MATPIWQCSRSLGEAPKGPIGVARAGPEVEIRGRPFELTSLGIDCIFKYVPLTLPSRRVHNSLGIPSIYHIHMKETS